MPSIQKLSSLVQQMLAAGEVIDYPASVLRELLDNAIDAKANYIMVTLEQGGLSSITVRDNGNGMEKSDLRVACKAHYTSKLKHIDDLNTLLSLGFRGEALSSISSVSKTVIQSGISEHSPGHSITVHNGKTVKESETAPVHGTVVTVSELFHAIPARRKFLRKATSEQRQCKQVFLDKACAHPNIQFSLYANGKQVFNFIPSTLEKRVALSARKSEAEFFTVHVEDTWFQAHILTSFPTTFRKDRNQIHIFINNRRISYFSLSQAIEYAARSVIPGGLFPYARVFLSVDSSMVDVNVHPAKREVKIKNIQYLHHQITTAVRRAYDARVGLVLPPPPSFEKELGVADVQPGQDSSIPRPIPQPLPHKDSSTTNSTRHHNPAPNTTIKKSSVLNHRNSVLAKEHLYPGTSNMAHARDHHLPIRHYDYPPKLQKKTVYLMQLHKKYLVCLIEDQLTIIDQHAAHERLLYNEFRASKETQPLSIPLEISTTEEEFAYIESIHSVLEQLHIHVERREKTWVLVSVPVILAESAHTISENLPHISLQQYMTTLYAQLACKRAIKAGETIAPKQAQSLIDAIVDCGDKRCPHGRPLLISLPEAELDRKLGRCLTNALMHK